MTHENKPQKALTTLPKSIQTDFSNSCIYESDENMSQGNELVRDYKDELQSKQRYLDNPLTDKK